MKIIVKSRHTHAKHFEKEKYKNAIIVDLTSRAPEPWVKFSPFYPNEDVPIPFSEGKKGASVEGVWQGLKVFESTGIDTAVMENRTMKRLKRTVRKYGRVRGHQKGLDSEELLGYIEARKEIYLPMYKWVLDNKLQEEVKALKKLAKEYELLVVLDYETNGDVENRAKPLSHAWLVKYYLEDSYPEY
ncbi:MAG: hypothetical protein GY810_07010 [Aureispira sp.]|nr:hypothetical protein [Aureispira sp.]